MQSKDWVVDSIDGIYYEIDENTQTALVKGADENITSAMIQSTVVAKDTRYDTKTQTYIVKETKTFPVTCIGRGYNDFAFANCTKLTSVNIPNSITHIKANAFSGCI